MYLWRAGHRRWGQGSKFHSGQTYQMFIWVPCSPCTQLKPLSQIKWEDSNRSYSDTEYKGNKHVGPTFIYRNFWNIVKYLQFSECIITFLLPGSLLGAQGDELVYTLSHSSGESRRKKGGFKNWTIPLSKTFVITCILHKDLKLGSSTKGQNTTWQQAKANFLHWHSDIV